MALVVEDRVRETSTTAGTGTFTLAGAVTGYQSFAAVGNGNTTYYTIYLQGGNEWEVGIGTYTSSGTTLSRDTVLASSSGGAKINFSAGVKDVFVTYPADWSVSQYDVGTGANQLPLNQYLGNLAYQDAGSIAGQVGLSAGTAALPSLVSATDTDTGMWFPAANTLAWSTGGSERARITSGGTFQTSLDASIYGVTVGRGASAVSSNTAVGANALAGNTSGLEQVAVGYDALFTNQTGSYNTAVGLGSLKINVSGSNNTAVGYLALLQNLASNNTAVGYQAGFNNQTGANNQVFGYQALYSNQTGSNNAAFGTGALYANTASNNAAFGSGVTAVAGGALVSNTTGERNAAFGGGAASANTTGNYNTALGVLALKSNTTASNNTAVGYQSLYSNNLTVSAGSFVTGTSYVISFVGTTNFTLIGAANNNLGTVFTATGAGTGTGTAIANGGGDNTAVGYQAGYSNTTGTVNSFFGNLAGYGVTTGNYNTALGNRALYAAAGDQNVAVGHYALNVTTGLQNTAVGSNALQTNAGGNYNVGIGQSALTSNTTASNNTAVGYQAGYSNQVIANQTFVGYQAGYSRATNNDNYSTVMVGNLAGYSTATGIDNTYIGGYVARYQTGSTNTAIGGGALYGVNGTSTGSSNTAIGYTALLSNTTASNNTAVGYQAGYDNTTGTGVVALGYQAGVANTTASYNIFIGTFAGQGAGSPITGGNNTAIGTSAGASLTSGTFNTFVGASGQVNQGSGGLITTGSKNTILGPYNGNQGGLDIRTASNYIVLSDGDGNPAVVVPKNSSGDSYLLVGPTKSDPTGANYYSTFSTNGADVQVILQRTGTSAGYAGIGASNESAFMVYGQGFTSVPFRVKQTDGTVILKDGATAATGTGITFPATQSASSNANTLDDYEEGTWTPTFLDVTYTASSTYTEGRYTKIGRVVTVVGVITTDSLDTGDASQVDIGGLPFTVENVNVSYTPATLFIEEGFNASGIDGYQAISVPGSTVIRFYTFTKQTSGNNYGSLLYNQLTDGSQGTRVRFQLTYIV